MHRGSCARRVVGLSALLPGLLLLGGCDQVFGLDRSDAGGFLPGNWEVGPAGWHVQLAEIPTAQLTLPSGLNTDTASECLPTPQTWLDQGQRDACLIVADSITVATTQVRGSRPLVLAANTLTITTLLDTSSHLGPPASTGPGAAPSECSAFLIAPAPHMDGAGGGAGASFMTAGGNGGAGDIQNQRGGTAPAKDAAEPSILRAGCTGQDGAIGVSGMPGIGGPGGPGGGAVYLVAGATITIGGVIDASGAAGSAIGGASGGGGGGSGGSIVVYAPTIVATGATLMANGGGGAADQTNNGSEPDPTQPTVPAAGGGATTGGGGAGFAGTTQAAAGLGGGAGKGGGGGGGGGGYIRASGDLSGATAVSPAAYLGP